MTDITDITPKSGAKSVAGQLHEVEQLLTEWQFMAAWATPEARAAFNHCRADVRRALGIDTFGSTP